MKAQKWLTHCVASIAWLGMFVSSHPLLAATPPVPAATAMPAPAALQIADVELEKGGMLNGRVVDGHGNGLTGAEVTVRQQQTVLAEAKCDAAGNFRIAGLPGGVYQLAAGKTAGMYRLWTTDNAPPGAGQGVLLVSDDQLVAGQYSPLKCWLADPLVIAGIVVLAVGVPVIIHNTQNNHNGS